MLISPQRQETCRPEALLVATLKRAFHSYCQAVMKWLMKTVKWQHLKTSPSTAVRLQGSNLDPLMLCTEQKHKKKKSLTKWTIRMDVLYYKIGMCTETT